MYTCRVLGSTFTMYVLLILVLTTCLCTARARVVIASRLPNKHKYNVTTPSVNDVTKWTGSINPGDTPEFLEQDLAVGYSSLTTEGKLTQMLLLMDGLSGRVAELQHSVSGLKMNNHMMYKQLKHLQLSCQAAAAAGAGGATHIIQSASQIKEQEPCPDEFHYHRRLGKCYQVGTDRISWRMARERCRVQDADLVSIETQREQRYLTDLARKGGETRHCDLWTGASDKGTEGVWRWIANGRSLSYTNWNIDEPNNGSRDEHCMYMMWIFDWKWNDGQCNFDNACYICEMPAYQ